MKNRQVAAFVSALFLALGLSAMLTPVFAAPLKIEDVSRFPAIENVALSPDGEHIIGLVAAPGQKWPVISVWKTEDLSARPVWIPTKEMRYHFVDFFGNDKLIFVAQDTHIVGSLKSFQRKLYISDLDGGDIEEPLRQRGTNRNSRRDFSFGIFFDQFEDSDRVYIESATWSTQVIYELNKRTGRKRVIAESSEESNFLATGVHPATGDLLVKQSLEPGDGGYVLKRYLRNDKASPWEYHPELSYDLVDRMTLDIAGFDGSAENVVVLTNKGSNFVEARLYNSTTRTWDEAPLFSAPGYDIVSVSFMRPAEGSMLIASGMTVAGPGLEHVSIHPYWAPVRESLKQQYPGHQISVYDERNPDEAGKHMAIVQVQSSQRPPEYYLYVDGQMSLLGKSRPWINSADMPKSEWVTYTARDGMKIPAILTLPPGFKKGAARVPVIVHPHGGPWARDYIGWASSGWVPFLATRGVAVLQPQYRGSTNLGMDLWKAGDSEWGQKMQDDKDDGAAWLVSEGIGDPDRLAIFGYSYGGFAAIAASVRPNSPYRCAISGAGVSNLDKLGNLWGGNRILRAIQGRTVDGMDPIENVDKANIPIMLYHGDHDRQADTAHSREFYKALKKAGKDGAYHEISEMWHQLPWWPSWQEETLALIEDYLQSEKCGIL